MEAGGHAPTWRHRLVPCAVFCGMASALFLLAAILPLEGLKFPDILLTRLGSWPLLPTRILFPGAPVALFAAGKPVAGTLNVAVGWQDTRMLLEAFVILFLWYLLALRWLPRQISFGYILISTLLLGTMCLFFPAATSGDVFAYIAYARIGVIYHLNPLITSPTSIQADPVYPFLYWIQQPSIYGPTWIIISSLLQRLLLARDHHDILSMVLALRVFGLLMHLASTWLIYSISGYLQHMSGVFSPEKRRRAVLAFAWNPFLLLEAGVNAHNDIVLLYLTLLAIWFLVRRERASLRTYLGVTAIFAVATCLKANIAVLAPGLLLFLWVRLREGQHPIYLRLFPLIATTTTYLGGIILLYAPFWQGEATLNALRVNPGVHRSINTFAESLSRLYNSLTYAPGFLAAPASVSPAQYTAHLLSTVTFLILYALLCWRAVRTPHDFSTIPGLLRWLALVWLLYCAIGSPWFWPWYLTVFFGLYALIEATDSRHSAAFLAGRVPLAVYTLAFSMLSLYCLLAWFPSHVPVPILPGFRWLYFSGLWAWGWPLLMLVLPFKEAGVWLHRYQTRQRYSHWTWWINRAAIPKPPSGCFSSIDRPERPSDLGVRLHSSAPAGIFTHLPTT
jgi:hypothetical protein